ncbi:hypothetical protein [Streptomyces sp. NPDC008122]|uniref:hypothetical protein n=1 Tax=Streptomyces sp. NPDC008122 TaxID=3364810 RepID=UPI0036E5467C
MPWKTPVPAATVDAAGNEFGPVGRCATEERDDEHQRSNPSITPRNQDPLNPAASGHLGIVQRVMITGWQRSWSTDALHRRVGHGRLAVWHQPVAPALASIGVVVTHVPATPTARTALRREPPEVYARIGRR